MKVRICLTLGVIFTMSSAARAVDLAGLFTAAQTPVAQTPVAIDWSQPPVGCVEDVAPAEPDRPCLDLTGVHDPVKEMPADLPSGELAYWKSHDRPLVYCRSLEILRREVVAPGTFKPGVIEISWMQAIAPDHRDEKIKSIYKASRDEKIPTQVLTGALFQESLLAELGISSDGGNYSCGVGQINLREWCHWANSLDSAKKAELGWPANEVACSMMPPSLIAPFYAIAKTRLNGLPEYRLAKEHFAHIRFSDVASRFPSGPDWLRRQRFQVAHSFIQNCMTPANGIAAKAHELKLLYNEFVPERLKEKEVYSFGRRFNRTCSEKGYEGAYPLSTAWLLAVGIYNAGPRVVDALAYYNRWNRADLALTKTWKRFTPVDMVQSFYWSGRYSPADDKIHYLTLDGGRSQWDWLKPCVLQRHIARVVQHVVLPGTPTFIDSLEGAYKCEKSQIDPATGRLLKSGVPPYRQVSSGRIASP